MIGRNVMWVNVMMHKSIKQGKRLHEIQSKILDFESFFDQSQSFFIMFTLRKKVEPKRRP